VAGREKQAYGFQYDELDRLTDAHYYDLKTNAGAAPSFDNDNKFNEHVDYDERGNITSLVRRGMTLPTWSADAGNMAGAYGTIDDMHYEYNSQNQVKRILDASMKEKGFKFDADAYNRNEQYTYDANGNMTSDPNKHILSIEYNYLNLPVRIVIDGQYGNQVQLPTVSIEFTYDAGGRKLRKRAIGSQDKTTDYVGGIEFENDLPMRIQHAEGSIVRSPKSGEYQHNWVLRDHLGNTRVTFKDGNVDEKDPNALQTYSSSQYDDGIVDASDIIQENHYYAFGLNMEGPWNGAAGDNKYQYNGKEWNDDFGLGWNDYGARFYDPAMARWVAVDPLAEKYFGMSPYCYVGNNPIKFIDPNGMEFINPHTERKKLAEIELKNADGNLNLANKKMEKWKDIDQKKMTKDDKKSFKADAKAQEEAVALQTDAKSNYDQESKFEKQVNSVLEKFATVNPVEYKKWNELKISGKKMDIVVSGQDERIQMTDDKGFPTGQTTTESGSYNAGGSILMILVYSSYTSGVIQNTSELVHGLGHFDGAFEIGEPRSEKYANDYEKKQFSDLLKNIKK
jgi:RHS repeat-associated protein